MKKNVFLIFYIICLFTFCSKLKKFTLLKPENTGIYFNNKITESDSLNIIDQANIYNGGGVGVGDFNNDGLIDIYFVGNQVANKLYLNKGNLQFIDITNLANVDGQGNWGRGVSIIDINNDGWLDIFVSTSLYPNSNKRNQLLYINQGLNNENIPIFKEMANEYNLNDTGYTTQTYFFDYDNDGDLDVFKVNNIIRTGIDNTNFYKPKIVDGSHPNNDKLFRNDFNPQLKHPVFTNVTKQAGILIEGFGHAAAIADINKDGWADIYVSNDFLSNDVFWINNKNGTFTNSLNDYFKHTSYNSMGNDFVDINNDGLLDLITLDMNPADNYRKKMMLNQTPYSSYLNNEQFNYGYQYVRNMLQINQGNTLGQLDTIKHPIFSEVGFYSGIAETDWSWTPLVADFDNDGLKDIFITNGFPKDITDHDFISFRKSTENFAPKSVLIAQVPEVKIHNYMYKNMGNIQFENKTNDWGFEQLNFSNGTIQADLDNDGDLEIIINNINDLASIYKNNSIEENNQNANFIKIKLIGDSLNINGISTTINIFSNNQSQTIQVQPTRGYISSAQNPIFFGIGVAQKIDSIQINWNNNFTQIIYNPTINTLLQVNKKDAKNFQNNRLKLSNLFTEITNQVGIHFIHQEDDYVDFNAQRLLPHKYSEYNPALAVGDLNNDGIEDFIVGSSAFHFPQIFYQQNNGKFLQQPLYSINANKKIWDDMGILIFDANKDGKNDIYIASGGYENKANTIAYKDHLFINKGMGVFEDDSNAIPTNFTSKSCVRAIDYDNDGDVDLFIGGRIIPKNYPLQASSIILRNDSKNGIIKFTEITNEIAKSCIDIGLICDALITDFNNDGWSDLIIVGEWMSPTLFINNKGKFEKTSLLKNENDLQGWWNSISAGDFNNDGKMDYIIANVGLNSYYRTSPKYPIELVAKDFDNNGSIDPILAMFLPNKNDIKTLYPFALRDDIVEQIPSFRKQFNKYNDYANITFNSLLNNEQLQGAKHFKATNFNSVVLLNKGDGNFDIKNLPYQAQWSALNGLVIQDFDGDGNLDIVCNTNDYSTEVFNGRYDALNGLFLKGQGNGEFKTLSILESGIYIPGNGKALVSISNKDNNSCMLVASQNRSQLKIFKLNKSILWKTQDNFKDPLYIQLKNGAKRKLEIKTNASFLSQSTSKILLHDFEKISANP